MDLSGVWRATVADDELRRTWLDDDVDDGWEPIDVPGHWRSNPAFADNDEPLLYRTTFEHERPEPGARLWLLLDGLFYQGDVWLDGNYVGDTEGYFFPHAFEVTEALVAQSEHQLGIEVTCSRPSDRSSKRNITGAFQHGDAVDPSWNPGGIWRPVRLERTGPVRIRHLRVRCREATEERAVVTIRAVLDAAETTEATVWSSVGDVDHIDVRNLAAGENQVEWTVTVNEPQRWWPHSLGPQTVHQVAVAVHLPDGSVSHRRTRRVGLRQVSLDGWVMRVNGERLFLKGTNLAPTRQALAEATVEEIERDVALAKDAGLDLVRINAHIARRELYDLTDRAGMLVWQDFPLHRGYARGVRKQAVRQAREAVDLLAHHPSIVVWCGHDEPFSVNGPGGGGSASVIEGRTLLAQELPTWNKSVLDRSVRRALERNDGTRPVVAHSGVLPHPPLLDGTDSHLFFGWLHGERRDLAGLARAVPRLVRFVSALGAGAVPDSVDFLEAERWPDLDWDELEARHGFHREAFAEHVPAVDHPTFDSWRRASQAYQAKVIRRQVETLRRLKYRPTGGFAQLFLADAHPSVGWSLVDHERRPKAGYQALVDACRPVIVVADELSDPVTAGSAVALDVHVVSDRRDQIDGAEVAATVRWEGGEQRWRFGGDIDADTVQRVGTLQIEVPDAPGPLHLDLVLTGPDVDATNAYDSRIVRS